MGLHKDVGEDNMHEPKGMKPLVSGAADIGKVVVSKGDGTTEVRKLSHSDLADTPVRMGMWDYNDVTTIATPIALTVADVEYPLTNDGAGPNTNVTYALPALANIWNVATNRLDFSMLGLGDTVDARIDVEVTTTGVNHEIALFWQFGEGGTPYELQIVRQNFKNAGTYTFTVLHSAYMGDANTRDNPSVFLMASDSTGDTVTVNGWFIRTITRSNF
tara:strand:+ start:138 stop:788 length:651 start_codon:yes stop_codon:yes gene_type:complete